MFAVMGGQPVAGDSVTHVSRAVGHRSLELRGYRDLRHDSTPCPFGAGSGPVGLAGRCLDLWARQVVERPMRDTRSPLAAGEGNAGSLRGIAVPAGTREARRREVEAD